MFYITTPIYYVNDDPHIGHLYTTISADVLARFHRLIGKPSYLLVGTDEHATKVVDAAKARNLSTEDWAKRKASVFAQAFENYSIQANDFIRTSEKRHIEEVQCRMKEMLASGDIYLGEYEGWYDKGQEEYVSELKARALEYVSPINKKPLVRRKEPCFYFKLSQYVEQVKNLIEQDELRIRPLARRQEMLARIRDGIKDIPCSRPRVEDWGVAVPGHEDQTVYVWIDALLNYLTAVDVEGKREFWPPKVQITGKDILWFHAVIWPAMLLALQKKNPWITLPKIFRAHAFWVRNGEKMSKSMGNFVSLAHLDAYSSYYGHDALRFYLMVAGPNEASDADFSEERLHENYNALLTNTLGNCCSRVTTMIIKYCEGKIPSPEVESGFPREEVVASIQAACSAAKEAEFPSLLEESLKIVRLTDAFIHQTEPFKLAKDPANFSRVCAILYDSLEALRLASLLLWPVMPSRMESFWQAISIDQEMTPLLQGGVGIDDNILSWGKLTQGATVHSLTPLFPRLPILNLSDGKTSL